MKIWGNGFRELCALAKKIHEIDKDVVIVAGGPQITMYREAVLRVTDAFDFLIYGEGEQAIVEFIEYLEGRRAVENVRNLIYSRNGVVMRTRPKLSQNLDMLPIPDWSIFQLQNYLPLFMMNFQRGCPFACSFCSHNYFWGRSAEDSELLGTDMTFIRQHGSICKSR
jgi:radical SAM superfamily enzyme YgiQ (UPF0313 family)